MHHFAFVFLNFRTLLNLGSLLWSNNIPLLVCHSYGFIGYMRIVLQEHCGNFCAFCKHEHSEVEIPIDSFVFCGQQSHLLEHLQYMYR